MSDNINNGGPAFPQHEFSPAHGGGGYWTNTGGMTLRQYAAIKLCVPESGTDWLDDMIRKAQRDRFAAQCIQASLGASVQLNLNEHQAKSYATFAYMVADAMIAEREVKQC